VGNDPPGRNSNPLARLLLAPSGKSHEEITFMNPMMIVAILVISAVPVCAQGQQPSAVKLRADAQNVVKIISGDKLKTQTYCEIAELSDQIDQEEDPTKAEELSQKRDQLERKLGSEFVALVGGLKDIDPNSQDGQEIGSILQELDKFCGISIGFATPFIAAGTRRLPTPAWEIWPSHGPWQVMAGNRLTSGID
jgi:hypothetical protein